MLYFNSLGHFSATVYYRPLQERIKHVYSLEQWQEKGMDNHSLYGDPKFTDYEAGNYNLDPDSPAYKLGFKAFDLSQFGLVKEEA